MSTRLRDLESARFAVQVMDSLIRHPETLPASVLVERKKLDVMYEKFGRFSEGSELARAHWLLEWAKTLHK